MSIPVLLGIDGGGTATIAWLADADGRVLGRGQAGPSNAKAVGAGAARRALEGAIAGAFRDADAGAGPVEVACLGLAGFDRPEDKELVSAWAEGGGWAHRLVLVNDGELVVAANPEGWGLGLIAGTGSIAVGRSPDGRVARSGGWGHLFGDEGSAYAVALAGLRRVARRADGREPSVDQDALTDRLCQALGIGGPSELVSTIYTPKFDRARIASLAPAVAAAAEVDPAVGDAILGPARSDLADLVSSVARQLGWRAGASEPSLPLPVPLALAGGFLLSVPALSDGLVEELGRRGLPVDVTRVPEPVSGAISLARRALLS